MVYLNLSEKDSIKNESFYKVLKEVAVEKKLTSDQFQLSVCHRMVPHGSGDVQNVMELTF